MDCKCNKVKMMKIEINLNLVMFQKWHISGIEIKQNMKESLRIKIITLADCIASFINCL
jgi:hypothetical protein